MQFIRKFVNNYWQKLIYFGDNFNDDEGASTMLNSKWILLTQNILILNSENS